MGLPKRPRISGMRWPRSAATLRPTRRCRAPRQQSEEERIRRFMEALGVPNGTASPPPNDAVACDHPAPSILSRLASKSFRHSSHAPASPPPRNLRRRCSPRPPRKLPSSKSQSATPPARSITLLIDTRSAWAIRESMRRALESPPGLQPPRACEDAIVLREIFGPPRSMQPLIPQASREFAAGSEPPPCGFSSPWAFRVWDNSMLASCRDASPCEPASGLSTERLGHIVGTTANALQGRA